MDAKKAPKLALVAGPKPKEDAEEDYGSSTDALAELLGVAPDKQADFHEAFEAAVKACK